MPGLLKTLLVYGGGDIFARLTTLITIPIFTRVFSPGDYGVLSLIATACGLLTVVLSFGFDSALARFFLQSGSQRDRASWVATGFWFCLGVSVAVTALCVLFSRQAAILAFGDDRLAILWKLSFAGVAVGVTSNLCAQILRNQFKAVTFVGLNALATMANLGLSIAFVVVLRWGLPGVVLGGLLAGLLMLPIRLYTVRAFLLAEFSPARLRALLGFGVPLVISGFAYWIFAMSDRFILGWLSTLSELGLYSVAAGLMSPIYLAHGSVGQAWWPYIVEAYERGPDRAAEVSAAVLTILLLSFGFAAVSISVLARPALHILAAPQFADSARAVAPLALAGVAYATTQVTHLGISLTSNTRWIARYSWIAAGCNLVLNLCLVPEFGMVGAAWGTLVAYLVLTLAYFFRSQRLWAIPVARREVMALSLLIAAFTLGGNRLPAMPVIASLAAGCGYVATFCVFALLLMDRRTRLVVGEAVPWLRDMTMVRRWKGSA